MMPTLLSIEALEADRRFAQQQLETVEDDPWGTIRHMWESRLAEIEEQLQTIAASRSGRASVAVFFDGVPVIGAYDIRLNFATQVLNSYQHVVSTAYVTLITESRPEGGPAPSANPARLYIRDSAHGSFGFILEELPSEQRDMFPTALKEAVEGATVLIATLSSPEDEQFGSTVTQTEPRLLAAVQQFAKVLYDAKASARIVGNEHQVALSLEDVGRLTSRLEAAVTEEDEFLAGQLRGILPDQRRFEFIPFVADRRPIRGRVSEDLVEKYLADETFRNRILAEPVRALIKHSRTIQGSRQVREQVFLESVELLGDMRGRGYLI
jgi:hypothetical protein